MTITSDQLRAALAELPDDPDRIADVYRLAGIKGPRCDACRCPTARWLHRRLGDDVVLVTSSLAEVAEEFAVPLPPAVKAFIRRFDGVNQPGGAYHDLRED